MCVYTNNSTIKCVFIFDLPFCCRPHLHTLTAYWHQSTHPSDSRVQTTPNHLCMLYLSSNYCTQYSCLRWCCVCTLSLLSFFKFTSRAFYFYVIFSKFLFNVFIFRFMFHILCILLFSSSCSLLKILFLASRMKQSSHLNICACRFLHTNSLAARLAAIAFDDDMYDCMLLVAP